MKNEDKFSILITFVMGLVAGGYLYLSQAASYEATIATPEAEEVASFELEAELYGSCENNCPSFHIGHDWSYRYSHVTNANGERRIEEGVLPFAYRQDFTGRPLGKALGEQSIKTDGGELCGHDPQGIEARYKITVAGTYYNLDSCGTTIQFESELWKGLNAIWGYFIKTESN